MINSVNSIATGLQNKSLLLGTRLKSAREALGMNSKDIADALRLQERIILMIESGEYQNDVPLLFMRGYIRSYSKLVSLPESELQEIMELMTPKPEINPDEKPAPVTVSVNTKKQTQLHAGKGLMRLFTCLLVITLISLMGIWWHNHKTNPVQNQTTIIEQMPETNAPATISTATTTMTTLQNPLSAAKPPAAQALVKRSTPDILNIMNSPLQFLLSLILFLAIILFSMRLYSSPVMAGVRGKRIKRQAKSGQGSLIKLRVKPSFILFAIVIALIGAGSFLLMKHKSSKPLTVVNTMTKQPEPVTEAAQEPATNEIDTLLMTALEAFMPTPTLNSLVLTDYQLYALQDMQMTLDNYIADAAATKFALTDKSMPIGQFVGKKSRRHRPAYYEEEETSSSPPPPYYYQQN